MPNQPMDVQVLVYRTDLLAQYGYKTPPRTWDELEKMAVRIQAGERAKGKKDFWGFVWAGAIATDSEQLIMEGLEWQAAEGGGHIIESDGKISVNNRKCYSGLGTRGTLGGLDLPSQRGFLHGYGRGK